MGVFCQGQVGLWAILHQGRQLLVQRVVNFSKHFACASKGIGQGHAHTDRLAALTGKKKREAHQRFVRYYR